MATTVNIHEAKTQLSRLLERVRTGEEVIIARDGTPIARLTKIDEPKRIPGRLKGLVTSIDFEAPLSENELRAWEGNGATDPVEQVKPT